MKQNEQKYWQNETQTDNDDNSLHNYILIEDMEFLPASLPASQPNPPPLHHNQTNNRIKYVYKMNVKFMGRRAKLITIYTRIKTHTHSHSYEMLCQLSQLLIINILCIRLR